MGNLLINCLGGVVQSVSGYFKDKQELKKIKLASEKKVIEAKANSLIAISEAKIHIAKTGQANDFSLDRLAMENMEKSYKDEFLLLLFSIPMIMAFLPKYADDALKGFEVIQNMPQWYQYTFIGMVVVIYGMRGMFTKFLDTKKITTVSKPMNTKITPIFNQETKKEAKGLLIHCSDSPQGRGDNAKTIDKWHRERGWSGIGYHYVILEDGTVETGRPLDRLGAHAKDYNDYVGICLIGKDSFTKEQFDGLEKLCGEFDTHNIIGHYKVSPKTCPNFDVEDFVSKRNL